MVLFQNMLLLKEFPSCNGCFGLFTKIKLKRGLGPAFGAHFLHEFFIKMLFNTLSIDRLSISYLFPVQDIKQNKLLRIH